MAFYTKEEQLRPKNGKTMSKQKANSTWGFKKPIKAKQRKTKKNEIIDKEYSAWLGTQPCIISGIRAKRGVGVNDIHCHHIKVGKYQPKNDHKQVPLLGKYHSWGELAYHNNTKMDWVKKHNLPFKDEEQLMLNFFELKADLFYAKYKLLKEKGEI